VQERNATYQRRRDLLIEGLRAAGLPTSTPRASLYLWVPIPDPWTSVEFAGLLLEKGYVSLTPGTVFGAQGEGYLRLSITAPEERIQEALTRLVAIREIWEQVPRRKI
jgi:LL-diaminopimelate aminotransferase